MTSKPIVQCQICHSDSLNPIFFFGYIPAVNAMQDISAPNLHQEFFPLGISQCTECNLVQINYEVTQKVLFPYSYPYLSGSTNILKTNFRNLAETCLNKGIVSSDSFIIDIGSNDGTLLAQFDGLVEQVLGIEPTQAHEVAIRRGIDTINDYFCQAVANKVKNNYPVPDLITAANVFAHIPAPNDIVNSIKSLMGEQSSFISENHYLPSIVSGLQYDTVYHEHLRYYHLGSLNGLFNRNGLMIYDVEKIPTHGGSIRVYSCLEGARQITDNVKRLMDEEEQLGLNSNQWKEKFIDRVQQSKFQLIQLLAKIKSEGKRIVGIGAPSRATTLINYCGIDQDLIDCVLEISSSSKLNKFIPGTKIPVLEESLLFDEQPDYALMLSWHIADELIPKLKAKGFNGQYIIPLPEIIIR